MSCTSPYTVQRTMGPSAVSTSFEGREARAAFSSKRPGGVGGLDQLRQEQALRLLPPHGVEGRTMCFSTISRGPGPGRLVRASAAASFFSPRTIRPAPRGGGTRPTRRDGRRRRSGRLRVRLTVGDEVVSLPVDAAEQAPGGQRLLMPWSPGLMMAASLPRISAPRRTSSG